MRIPSTGCSKQTNHVANLGKRMPCIYLPLSLSLWKEWQAFKPIGHVTNELIGKSDRNCLIRPGKDDLVSWHSVLVVKKVPYAGKWPNSDNSYDTPGGTGSQQWHGSFRWHLTQSRWKHQSSLTHCATKTLKYKTIMSRKGTLSLTSNSQHASQIYLIDLSISYLSMRLAWSGCTRLLSGNCPRKIGLGKKLPGEVLIISATKTIWLY